MLLKDVRDAVGDLVEIIQTYKAKNKMSQVLTSTLFKRRQEEAEAVINDAIGRLQVGSDTSVRGNVPSSIETPTVSLQLIVNRTPQRTLRCHASYHPVGAASASWARRQGGRARRQEDWARAK